ncbi:MAG: MaoC family dehydratase [Nannocystaceae bacterium]
MRLPSSQIVHQGPVLATLGRAAFTALRQQLSPPPSDTFATPGPVFETTIAPRAKSLLHEYQRHICRDTKAYRGVVPPHLWPQWGFPLTAKTLTGVPYPLLKVLNGGCRLEVHAPLPANEPLKVSAQLMNIDETERRAVLHQRVTTGTQSTPNAIEANLYAIVPLTKKRPKGETTASRNREEKPRARVPLDALELDRWRLPTDAGLAYAMLTGDFNPVHWVPSYARAFGFKNTILHGFATMARTWETLRVRRFSGDITGLQKMDVKFTRPLVLPARVGVFTRDEQVWVGDAPGAPAYLEGTFHR